MRLPRVLTRRRTRQSPILRQSGQPRIVFDPTRHASGSTTPPIKIDSFKEIPQSLATDVRPGYNNPGTIQCNTYGTIVTCNRIGAVNIPASSTTYDVNGELRDRYVVRCLQSKGFTVKMDGRACATEAETKRALADREAGQFPQCAVRAGS
ncbi:MAG: hypothetical protein EOQ80_33110 [Mesorhizobium sp.]|nr:hypothetical protein [Mesorhizobium sp.]RWH34440.1 MAG: hypothetical protein EOQ80_33110 [Mesorhizobium sp.]TIR09349.1 MAG: hypothetical protein E5X37_16185 [Mesorhizobium sp.]